jgi:hypothetical protein
VPHCGECVLPNQDLLNRFAALIQPPQKSHLEPLMPPRWPVIRFGWVSAITRVATSGAAHATKVAGDSIWVGVLNHSQSLA